MDLKFSESAGIMPIMAGFVSKIADEVGYPRLIIGTLLSLILFGIGFNLNSISTDIREIRKSMSEEAMPGQGGHEHLRRRALPAGGRDEVPGGGSRAGGAVQIR